MKIVPAYHSGYHIDIFLVRMKVGGKVNNNDKRIKRQVSYSNPTYDSRPKSM